jgi:hypothetical protein
MSPEFFAALKKGIYYYMRDEGQYNKRRASPFPGTFNTPRNLLQEALRENDEIGWSNLLKGRIAIQWKVYTKHHIRSKFIQL